MMGRPEFYHYQQFMGSKDKAIIKESRMSRDVIGGVQKDENVLSSFHKFSNFRNHSRSMMLSGKEALGKRK